MARKILVADDIETNRQILKRILRDDYDVLEAENGEEVLSVLMREHENVSAVLLDIIMPVMDGYEALKRIRLSPALSQIPVIVTTGNTEPGSEVRALSLGANDFIAKPFNSEIIKHRLWNTINLRETAAVVNAAQRDDLTGLYNRKTFFAKTAEMIASHEPGYYVMACFDIDNFKVINDQYGSVKGDAVLRFIAETFAKGFDPVGGIACRIMADHFAVLYPASFMDTPEIAEIRRAAALLDGTVPPITFSIGRYIVDDKSLSISAMYDRAAIAEASVKGRFDMHIAQYDESMREEILREQEIINEMNGALEKEQFEVWFQPQYNHSTGALIGAEALVRWRHPRNGLVPPGVFIPVFERNGFIYELDKYVWEQTCRYLKKWIDEGRAPLPVSVNISRYDVFREDLIETITGLVNKYDIPVELLRLEITESAFAKSTRQIISVVKRLMEHGFTIEIDDFGSGYSSLNTLKDVPAEILKLDMRFLENEGHSSRGGNILESIVRMAKWLGMAIIAEGVETREQADFLKSIGCNYVQGYLYARPMPASEYEALAKGTRKEEKMIALETVKDLDNNAFWDPKSMDTLIFNSYMGGACIFEYHNGEIELLRANDKYAKVIGSAGLTVDEALRLDWSRHLDEENSRIVAEALRESIDTGDEVVREFVFRDLPGCPAETYLRSTMRVIASSGNRHLVYCTNENMTGQRVAEHKERATSEQLQAIMESISGGIVASVIGNDKAEIIFSNNRYYEILGYTKQQYEEAFGGCYGPISPKDAEWVVPIVEEAMRSGESRVIEYRAIKRDGTEIWVRQNVTSTRLDGIEGAIQLSALYDVTTEKEAERKTHEVAEQMQAIMNGVNGGVSAATLINGKIGYIFVNEEYYSMFGYTKEQFLCELPRGLVEIIHPEDLEAVYASAAETEVSGSARIEFRVRRRDGSEMFVRSNSSTCFVEGIDAPIHIAVINDITKERETERQIRYLNDSLTNLMNDTPGGFCRLRLKNRLGVVDYVNDSFCTVLGMTRSEVMESFGHDAMRAVHPDDREIFLAAVGRGMEKGERMNIRCRLRHGDGSYMWFRVFGRITEDEAGEVFMNGYYTDLSEAEELVRIHGEEVKAAMAQMGKMICEYDPAAHLLLIPDKYAEKHGYPTVLKNVPERSHHSDFFDAESLEGFLRFYEMILGGEKSGSVDVRCKCADGSWCWERFDFVSIFGVDGKPVKTIISVEDTTEQHSTELEYEALKEKERLLRLRAETDSMTGLYNRAATENAIRGALEKGGGAPRARCS